MRSVARKSSSPKARAKSPKFKLVNTSPPKHVAFQTPLQTTITQKEFCSCGAAEKGLNRKHTENCDLVLSGKKGIRVMKTNLAKVYTNPLPKLSQKVVKQVLPKLGEGHLKLDVDLLGSDMEMGIIHFVQKSMLIRKITLYSNLLRIDELTPQIDKSKPIPEAAAFTKECEKFRQENKIPPGSFAHRYSQYYSVDLYFNERLIRGCALNVEKSKLLSELTLFGIHMSSESC